MRLTALGLLVAFAPCAAVADSNHTTRVYNCPQPKASSCERHALVVKIPSDAWDLSNPNHVVYNNGPYKFGLSDKAFLDAWYGNTVVGQR